MASKRSISDYALIGDCRTAALIADGSVEWMCAPRFDSPSVFAALLDQRRGGSFAIRPRGPYRSHRRYDSGSNVLVTRFVCRSGQVELTDCLAVHGQDKEARNGEVVADRALVRVARCTTGRVTLAVSFDPRPDYARAQPHFVQQGRRWLVEAADQRLALDSTAELEPAEGSGLQARLTLRAGEETSFVVHYASPPKRPLADAHDAVEAIERTRDAWRAWSGSLRYDGRYRDQVERSALVLKALMYEPTGAIVAAPTTSLPECLDGHRNWDYRYSWLRDSTLTLYALEQIGFDDDARKFRRWLECASHDDPAQLRIAYTIDGGELPSEMELRHLSGFDGVGPVRIGNDARDQRQLDVFGELLDVAFFAAKHDIEIDAEYWSLLSALADFVCDHWQQPDHGMWEVRSEPRQFTYSKMYCWVCLNRALRIARSLGRDVPRRWRQAMDAIHAEVLKKGYDESIGAFVQSYGSKHLDAATLLLPIVGFINARDPRMISTVRNIEERLSDGGFLCRYIDAADGISGDEGTFTLCSFWLVDVLVMQGERRRARRLFERLLDACNDVGLLSEEYDPRRRRSLGNFPQAFSHMGLITSAVNLRGGQPNRRHSHRAAVGRNTADRRPARRSS